MGYFFASLINTVFSMFLFFHFSISMSRINDAVGVRKGIFVLCGLLYRLAIV